MPRRRRAILKPGKVPLEPKRSCEGGIRKKGGVLEGEDGMLRNVNPRTGKKNRRYFRRSEYHLLSRCPNRARVSTEAAPRFPPARGSSRPPYSSMSVEGPVVSRTGSERPSKFGDVNLRGAVSGILVHRERWRRFSGLWAKCEFVIDQRPRPAERFSTSVIDQRPRPASKWLKQHTVLDQRNGSPAADARFAKAKFKFGDGSLEGTCLAADVPLGIVAHLGKFVAFSAKAGISALLRRGALEALGGKLEFPAIVCAGGSWVCRRRNYRMRLDIMF